MRSGTKIRHEHAIWRGCKGKGLFYAFIHAKNTACGLLGSEHCASQAAQGLDGAIFTLRVTPPTSPRSTLSVVAEPIFEGKFPRN